MSLDTTHLASSTLRDLRDGARRIAEAKRAEYQAAPSEHAEREAAAAWVLCRVYDMALKAIG